MVSCRPHLFALLVWVLVPTALAAAQGPSQAATTEEASKRGGSASQPALGQPVAASPASDETPVVLPEGSGTPSTIVLEPGQIHTLVMTDLERIAIGDPKVVDVTLVSPSELLVQAKAVGKTNLIVWDHKGQRLLNVEVVDRAPEFAEGQLRQLIAGLGLAGVQVQRKDGAIFLMGQVSTEDELGRLEQLLSAYKRYVTNLVTVAPAPPAPSATPSAPLPSVKLTVYVVEMSHDATDRVGVDWMDKLTVTETPFSALTPTSVDLHERIDEALRIGSFSRTGSGGAISATLDLLASQGKARILAEPKLVAASGKEAVATLGVEVPVITATSVSATSVTQNIEFKQTGVELKFRPTVLGDGRSIQLVINAKVSSIDITNAIKVSGVTVPGFKVRHAETEIVTESGRAVFIAGLLQDEEKKNLSQIPGIGSIPVLGNLFRSTEFIRGQTELVIVVTPELTTKEEPAPQPTVGIQSPPVLPVEALQVSPTPDARLRYALQIQERVAKSLQYPQHERESGVAGQVKLRLHLFQDGTLAGAIVVESSGSEAFDQEALRAAESQSPYPPFPPDLAQPDLWLELPVHFRP